MYVDIVDERVSDSRWISNPNCAINCEFSLFQMKIRLICLMISRLIGAEEMYKDRVKLWAINIMPPPSSHIGSNRLVPNESNLFVGNFCKIIVSPLSLKRHSLRACDRYSWIGLMRKRNDSKFGANSDDWVCRTADRDNTRTRRTSYEWIHTIHHDYTQCSRARVKNMCACHCTRTEPSNELGLWLWSLTLWWFTQIH